MAPKTFLIKTRRQRGGKSNLREQQRLGERVYGGGGRSCRGTGEEALQTRRHYHLIASAHNADHNNDACFHKMLPLSIPQSTARWHSDHANM